MNYRNEAICGRRASGRKNKSLRRKNYRAYEKSRRNFRQINYSKKIRQRTAYESVGGKFFNSKN